MPSAGCIPAISARTFPEYRLPCGASRTGCAAFCVLRHCRGAASSTSREAPADRYREHEKSKRSRFVIARSEATWQSREGTYSSYRPSLKQRATIVSAAALPERHGDWQNTPALIPRQSRAGSCDFADGSPVIRPCTVRLPRPLRGLAMTIRRR